MYDLTPEYMEFRKVVKEALPTYLHIIDSAAEGRQKTPGIVLTAVFRLFDSINEYVDDSSLGNVSKFLSDTKKFLEEKYIVLRKEESGKYEKCPMIFLREDDIFKKTENSDLFQVTYNPVLTDRGYQVRSIKTQ